MQTKTLYVTRDKKPDDNYGNEYCFWVVDGGGKGPVMDSEGLWGEGHDNVSLLEGLSYQVLLPQIKAMKLRKGEMKKVRLEIVVVEEKK